MKKMIDTLDLLQCPGCGTFYAPETTATARIIPHCMLPDRSHRINSDQRVEYRWLHGEVYVDFETIERRVLEQYGLTGGVVDPPLTGSLLDIEV